MPDPDLEPISPVEAVEMYHDAMVDELAESTRKSNKHRLRAFIQFCDEEEIENLNDLTGRDLYKYRIWRREGNGDGREPIKKVTLKGQLATLRSFLKFAGEIDSVKPDLYEQLSLPAMKGGEDVSESTLDPERALDILEYLEKSQPGSRDHIIIALLWETGGRTGAIRGLDLQDLDLDGDHPRFSGPAVHFVHRPETGTPLKNQKSGTRWNRISEKTAAFIEDYIEFHRPDVTDDHGRDPLLTSEYGRVAGNTYRRTLYRVTRPCWRGEECPHDRDLDECEATHLDHASKCPSARSPHDVRSGRVTYYRREDVPRKIVQERLNASEDILDRHYDRRSNREQAEQRSDFLPDV
ncbi:MULTISPECIES: tyrosine-type recombinase/integrase [Halomicrobium]|uniref:Integrase family protein n=2 Tax=Halomicrobium mukohataei TaxID=57705 RepID=C7P186_HALMD|nr:MULTISPECIES: tyrosine-type recombinase/integrase [Halomicrobium]ACV47094.1 integrase family protein [Halomicrobium mukohataei DSM 12286]QCD65579.1 site-specific integrase [Halomicrobium mukohataei]QFR20385.1 tyrosine-type recombinase/integrase [Halomicrobium sp. ZPS1]